MVLVSTFLRVLVGTNLNLDGRWALDETHLMRMQTETDRAYRIFSWLPYKLDRYWAFKKALCLKLWVSVCCSRSPGRHGSPDALTRTL